MYKSRKKIVLVGSHILIMLLFNMNSFITFRLKMDIYKENNIKKITYIPDNWKQLTDINYISNSEYYGVLTGFKNNITVIDFGNQSQVCPNRPRNTFKVNTPNGCHYYFKYEPKLLTTYNKNQHYNILNDSACAFVSNFNRIATKYTIPKEVGLEIAKMPQEMFDYFYEQQMAQTESVIDLKIYELLSLLPSKWFNDRDLHLRIVYSLRNTHMDDDIMISTIQRLLTERCDRLFEKNLVSDFALPMTLRMKESNTILSIQKLIRRDNETEYNLWDKKWNSRTKNKLARRTNQFESFINTRTKHTKGSLIKLSDLQQLYSNTYNATFEQSDLLAINKEYTSKRYATCKECSQLFVSGCCIAYCKDNRSSSIFIQNIELLANKAKSDTHLREFILVKTQYKEGALTKLSDLKEMCFSKFSKSLDTSDLLKINNEFTFKRCTICKSCKNIHKKGCCDAYNQKNKSSSIYIQNIEIL